MNQADLSKRLAAATEAMNDLIEQAELVFAKQWQVAARAPMTPSANGHPRWLSFGKQPNEGWSFGVYTEDLQQPTGEQWARLRQCSRETRREALMLLPALAAELDHVSVEQLSGVEQANTFAVEVIRRLATREPLRP